MDLWRTSRPLARMFWTAKSRLPARNNTPPPSSSASAVPPLARNWWRTPSRPLGWTCSSWITRTRMACTECWNPCRWKKRSSSSSPNPAARRKPATACWWPRTSSGRTDWNSRPRRLPSRGWAPNWTKRLKRKAGSSASRWKTGWAAARPSCPWSAWFPPCFRAWTWMNCWKARA